MKMTSPLSSDASHIPEPMARLLLDIVSDVAMALHESGHTPAVDFVLRCRPRDSNGRRGCRVEIRPCGSEPSNWTGRQIRRRVLATATRDGYSSTSSHIEVARPHLLRVDLIPVLSGGWKLALDAGWSV